jgi:hypothetical protein
MSTPKGKVRYAKIGGGGIRQPELPDYLHVVFCRILGIESMAADQLAATMQALHDTCQAIKDDTGSGVYEVHSSVYGRFLCVRDTVPAMKAATRVLTGAASRGVQLAVGVAAGRLERADDLSHSNLVGHPINRAARLAATEAAAGHAAIEEGVASQACRAGSGFTSQDFSSTLKAKVKATELEFRLLHQQPVTIGTLSGITQFRAFDAHTVVCDIAKFSQQDADGQWGVVTSLRREVIQALRPLAGSRADRGRLWQAPAGDGYVLVFAPDDGGGDVAWAFASQLAAACQGRVAIRIGIATGQVVIIGEDLPVGPGILDADKASGFPATGGICANLTFWRGRRDYLQSTWPARPVDGWPDMLLLQPQAAGAQATPGSPPSTISPAGVSAPGGSALGPGMILKVFISKGYLDILANLFNTSGSQSFLLSAVGFPAGQIPVGTANALDFWQKVCELISNGAVAGLTLEGLLGAASRHYPGSPALKPFAKD